MSPELELFVANLASSLRRWPDKRGAPLPVSPISNMSIYGRACARVSEMSYTVRARAGAYIDILHCALARARDNSLVSYHLSAKLIGIRIKLAEG